MIEEGDLEVNQTVTGLVVSIVSPIERTPLKIKNK